MKGITPKICMLCFVLINSVILNLLCVRISFLSLFVSMLLVDNSMCFVIIVVVVLVLLCC